MKNRHGFRWILLGSICVHLVLLASLLSLFYRAPEVVVITPASPEEPQFVDLFEGSALPDDLKLPDLSQALKKNPTENMIAFKTFSSLPMEPSPTPTPTLTPSPLPSPSPTLLPTATPTPLPTPTVRPTSTPQRPRTPMPRFNWTPKPRPTLRGTVKPAIRLEAFEVPKRDGVLEPTPIVVRRTPFERDRNRRSQGQQHFLGSRSSVVLDQENEFPFPEYLLHLEEKIAGLWFPQGTGTVTIYLEIDRNGKILKSEVDKGTGVGVKKLQESVVRALSLIKNFKVLPWGYPSTTLRVRIIVRR